MSEIGQDMPDGAFRGAKLLLFLGGRLVVLRRDQRSDIPWPGYLDFPGGGREDGETAVACALRETREEIGLRVPSEALIWRHRSLRDGGINWFFAAELGPQYAARIRLGEEGSGWALMAPEEFLGRADAIPHFRDILRLYLDARRDRG